MAAMAPALTDAPAEAHRIRFKLAPSSSTLSPSGVEGSGTGNHILVSSNGAVKRKASEERPSRGAGPCKPLVTSYHCSDVSSAKESLKLQGVLLQTHSILPSLIPRKHQALELCEEQPKSIMSAIGGGGPCGPPTVQGATVNGGETDVEEDELARVDIEQRHIPLCRRAEGRYAVDRAAIISHWNWLQAQVSDLEYRIRQQTDIYRQIRSSKVCTFTLFTLCRPVKTDTFTACFLETSVSSNAIITETGLRKSCGAVRQVNGVINRNVAFIQSRSESQQKLEMGPQASRAHDNTCVAARTRPLLSCRKRRVLRPGSLTSLNRKVRRIRSVAPRCGCELNAQCVMCSGRALPPADTQHQLPLLDRLAQFDPCVHPILSFTDDVMMNLHMQRVLKGHWQNRLLEKIKPIKKMSLKHKLCLGSRISDPSSKDKHKLASSLLSTVRDTVFGLSIDAPKLNMDVGSPCPSLSALNTPTHSPLMRQPSISETSTPLHLNSSTATIRRRRGESPFDINNIVIPMSVAATTRVEKLQYKEILTPSWREVDTFAKPISEEDDAIEDLSDVTFSQLHLPCEEQERSRWSWTASNIAKRRGSRSYKSVDGRTTPLLCGTNPSTPQPSSPDTAHFHMLHDYNSVASPSSPVSPEMLMLSGLHTPGYRDSQRLLSNEDTSMGTFPRIYVDYVLNHLYLHSACVQFLSGQKRTKFACP
uniref:KAT8 regulatory NSL complex subunit 1-like n=1 Tax=Sinocyclocheilus grahami TaxID=75366 RepID=A0A672SJ77_SINGR